MSHSLRLFIASTVSSEAASHLQQVRAQIARPTAQAGPASRSGEAIRWTQPEQWHLTWHFLGQTPEARIPDLQANLDEAVKGQASFAAEWDQLTWWPSRNRPQVLVYRMHSHFEFQHLAERIVEAVVTTLPAASQDSPIKHYKTFKPHITLARVKQARSRPERQAKQTSLPDIATMEMEGSPWKIDEISLFSSELTPAGAIHTALHTVRLGS